MAIFEIGSGTYSFSTDSVLGDIGDATDGVDALSELIDKGKMRRPAGIVMRLQTARLGWQVHRA